jgi:hypothetical protein
MGTIRKMKGEYFYRKDGLTFKFLNQQAVKKRFPELKSPVPIADDEVKAFSVGFLQVAALVDVFLQSKEETVEQLDKGGPISPAAQQSIDAIKCMDSIIYGAKTPEWKTEHINNSFDIPGQGSTLDEYVMGMDGQKLKVKSGESYGDLPYNPEPKKTSFYIVSSDQYKEDLKKAFDAGVDALTFPPDTFEKWYEKWNRTK